MTGCSGVNYVKDIVLYAAKNGFHPVVVNSLMARDEDDITDYRVLDFSDSKVLRASVDLVHQELGNDVDIYAIGFSLGANHVLRYLGAHHHDHGIKAAVSVSNPFDVLATCVKLKYRFFGLYDKVIRVKLAEPFLK